VKIDKKTFKLQIVSRGGREKGWEGGKEEVKIEARLASRLIVQWACFQ